MVGLFNHDAAAFENENGVSAFDDCMQHSEMTVLVVSLIRHSAKSFIYDIGPFRSGYHFRIVENMTQVRDN